MSPGAEGRYQRRLLDWNRQNQQMGHTSGAGDLTTHGFLPRREPPQVVARAGAQIIASPLNLVPRGEFNPALTYSAFDMVTIHGGGNAGVWYATEPIAASAAEPGTANATGWIKMGEIVSETFWH